MTSAAVYDAVRGGGPAVAVMLPAIAAAAMVALGRRGASALPSVVAIGGVIVAVSLAVVVSRDGQFSVALGLWKAPVGIRLRVDALSGVFLVLGAVVAALVWPYANTAHPHPPGGETRAAYTFRPLFLFLIAGLNAVFLSADLFNLYVALEVTGLAAVALVALEGGAAAVRAQLRYLLFATAGSLLYLLGVAILYADVGVLDIAQAADRLQGGPATRAAAVLMTVGLLLKAAIWPLHFWLPQAHANAPSAVSALLSALVVKAALYLLFRLWFGLFGAAMPDAAWTFIGVLGAGAVLWGSVLALRQERLKLMIAYSTVAQLGYMLFVFPLVPAGGAAAAEAWAGALLQVVSHGLAKAGMFLAAGALVYVLGGDTREHLQGASRRAPLPLFALALAGLSIIALPPSGGFLAKWLLLRAALTAEIWWLVAVQVAGGLLAAGYLFRFLLPALTPPRSADDAPGVVSPVYGICAMALALLSVLLGLSAGPVLSFLGPIPMAAGGVGP